MTEPVTTQKSLIVPNTGDLSGTWGTAALNPNFQTLDALFGGITTITLSSATTILLSVPATTGVWGGTLSQSVNALIRFTGAQTASATIQFTLPGFYIIENNCTGTTSVRLQPANLTGNSIGAIPGKKQKVFFDGVHMDYIGLKDPGEAYDLHCNTTTLPPWMTVCSVKPYLIKDGSTYSSSVYVALNQLLGSTYGGDGVATFGVPDERNRMRVPVDTVGVSSGTTSNRIQTSFNGTTFNASGGLDATTMTTGNLPPYTPSGSVPLVGVTNLVQGVLNSLFPPGSSVPGGSLNNTTPTASFSGNAQGGTSKAFTNVPPAVVSMLALIKT
jgi:microcystin-dependent protein